MKTYLLLPLVLLLLTGCFLDRREKNPEPQLPPETQHGANTFGCRVNGKIWVPHKNKVPGQPGLSANYNGSSMWVLAHGDDDVFIKIDFSSGITQVGDYTLYQSGPSSVAYYSHPTKGTYRTDSLTNGTLTMTRLDNQNSIVSGRFHFNAVNHLGDTVRITDGRFDVKYRYP